MSVESSVYDEPISPLAIRYVDAVDFGRNPLEWVLLVREEGHVILTVEGLPIARVEPVRPSTDALRNESVAPKAA